MRPGQGQPLSLSATYTQLSRLAPGVTSGTQSFEIDARARTLLIDIASSGLSLLAFDTVGASASVQGVVTAVPEAQTLAMWLAGVALLATWRRRPKATVAGRT